MANAKRFPKLRKYANENDSAYAALSRLLIERIHAGYYVPGQKMEGTIRLAEEFHLGRHIAASALDLLELKGFVRAEPRRGFFICDDVRPGLNSKLGIYICEQQPFQCADELHGAYHTANKYGYDLVYGSDTEKGSTLKKFLATHRDLDGLLVGGILNDQVLKPLLNWKKPYVLLGYFDVNPVHECADANFYQVLEERALEALERFRGKTFGAVVGSSDSPSDRRMMEVVARAAERAGCIVKKDNLFHINGNSIRTINRMINEIQPDVCFSLGVFLLGFARHAMKKPNQKRPWLISVDDVDYPRGMKSAVNETLRLDGVYRDFACDAVERLVAKLTRSRS